MKRAPSRRRSSGSSGGGSGGGGLRAILASPITPVLIGLVVVLGVGAWVLKDKMPTAPGDKTEQKGGQTGSTQPNQPTQPTQPEVKPSPQPEAPKPETPKPETETKPEVKPETKPEVKPANPAVATDRSKIDRSGGAAKSMLLTLYYADGLKNATSLQPVEIKVELSAGRIRSTVEQILTPPQDLSLYSGIPAGTKIGKGGVNLKDGVAIVDLSPEVLSVRGSAAVTNITASLVYSLTAIPDVKAVQLWVNGQPAMLDGMEWSKPLSRADLDGRNWYKVEPVIKYSEKE